MVDEALFDLTLGWRFVMRIYIVKLSVSNTATTLVSPTFTKFLLTAILPIPTGPPSNGRVRNYPLLLLFLLPHLLILFEAARA